MSTMYKKEECVILVRVSDTKQTYGESQEDQIEACQRVAKSKNLSVAGIFVETFSGRKGEAPVYKQTLQFIKDNPGRIKYFLVRVIDRFTRKGSGEYSRMKEELRSLGVELIDTHGIIQPSINTLDHLGFEYDWSRHSPSEIAEVVVSTTAKQEVTRILTRTITQEIRLAQQGYRARGAYEGYVNKDIIVGGKKKKIQVPCPERAKYFIRIFELRAEGKLSDKEIVEEINAMGYVSKEHFKRDSITKKIIGKCVGKPMTVKRLQNIVKRTIYAGVQVEKWTYDKGIRTPYPGLIPVDLFNLANRGKVFITEKTSVLENGAEEVEILYDYSPVKPPVNKYLRHNPDFPYKFIRCPKCKALGKDKGLKGSASKGRSGQYFGAYHCTRGHKRFSVSAKTMSNTVEEFLDRIKFSDDFLLILNDLLINKYRRQQEAILGQSRDSNSYVSELKGQKLNTVRAITRSTSEISQKALEMHLEELDKKIKKAEAERHTIDLKEEDVKKFISYVKKIVEHPTKVLLDKGNARRQAQLFTLVFEHMPTYDEIESGTAKLTFVFKLLEEFQAQKSAKSAMACLQGFGWNHIRDQINLWLYVCATL